MTFRHPFSEHVNLFVEDRISERDAKRQEATAREILKRLESRPGVILADEVGMGKTFVALAVAVSVILSLDRKQPVVVMVPSSLKDKWPRDFDFFRQKCLKGAAQEKIKVARAERAVEFLKLLDDPPARRKHLIFLTHGALRGRLSDGWVKIALIHRALHRRHNTGRLRTALGRCMGRLLHMTWVDRKDQTVWEDLLGTPPEDWLRVLRRHDIDPEGDDNPDTDDDPVPQVVIEVLREVGTGKLYETLQKIIPKHRTSTFKTRVGEARGEINKIMEETWKKCIKRLRLNMPLLILDEAHHLKNSKTRLASLFQAPEAAEDADEITKGPLAGVFQRMLFLTATPFQLGHHELCSVLERFMAVRWKGPNAPPGGSEAFAESIGELRKRLDRAQEMAVGLDTAWGRLKAEDLVIGDRAFGGDSEAWWKALRTVPPPNARIEGLIRRFEKTRDRMKEAEQALKPFVIRHLRSRTLDDGPESPPRRLRLVGSAITLEDLAGLVAEPQAAGIPIADNAVLPFLLAARAAACAPTSRPVFAEGLASSYEAFLHTRKHRKHAGPGVDAGDITDSDDDAGEECELSAITEWYLSHLQSTIPLDDLKAFAAHPKVAPTVRCVADLWQQGEKVVVFCHYIATGRALRQKISGEILARINRLGARELGCPIDDAPQELERIGLRFFDTDSPIRRGIDGEVGRMLKGYPGLDDFRDDLVRTVRRYFRTPAFLVRYFPLRDRDYNEDSISKALGKVDASGLSLGDHLEGFFEFLSRHCGERNRPKYVDALNRIQTGSHYGDDALNTIADDELQGSQKHQLLPNVRLVNGPTKQETRQRLMLTFNTPFYPEVLISSSVLAEGVDLHLNCRYVIHHDLCWNPSTLEQRTGRIDRIGAKAEKCMRSIHVYLPFVAATQDEKMYRVVMDRERWFKVVMGEEFRMDVRTTDRLAERIPLPESLAGELALSLEVFRPDAEPGGGFKGS